MCPIRAHPENGNRAYPKCSVAIFGSKSQKRPARASAAVRHFAPARCPTAPKPAASKLQERRRPESHRGADFSGSGTPSQENEKTRRIIRKKGRRRNAPATRAARTATDAESCGRENRDKKTDTRRRRKPAKSRKAESADRRPIHGPHPKQAGRHLNRTGPIPRTPDRMAPPNTLQPIGPYTEPFPGSAAYRTSSGCRTTIRKTAKAIRPGRPGAHRPTPPHIPGYSPPWMLR